MLEAQGEVGSLRWGVLGGGRIAEQFLGGIGESKTATLVAVGSRDLKRAQALAERIPTARGYGSYAEVVTNPEVDAVYIATLNPNHLELITMAAGEGKHILCEKPITLTAQEACVARDATRESWGRAGRGDDVSLSTTDRGVAPDRLEREDRCPTTRGRLVFLRDRVCPR